MSQLPELLSREFWVNRDNRELGQIHRRTLLEATAIPVTLAIAWFGLDSAITNLAKETVAHTISAVFSLIGTTGAMAFAGFAGAESIRNIRRRGNIFKEAAEMGLGVRGGFWREQIY